MNFASFFLVWQLACQATRIFDGKHGFVQADFRGLGSEQACVHYSNGQLCATVLKAGLCRRAILKRWRMPLRTSSKIDKSASGWRRLRVKRARDFTWGRYDQPLIAALKSFNTVVTSVAP